MVHKFAGFELDETSFELRARGERVRVEPKVLELLFLLVKRRPALVTKKEIFESVWAGVRVGEASLARAVMEARRAIGDDAQTTIITVRGKGFRFVGETGADSPTQGTATPVRPALVGREAYVAALLARYADAQAGHGSHVWLSGDAGSGKSRVAEEVAERARAEGAVVRVARCAEDLGTPPLWPWIEVARGFSPAMEAALGDRTAAPFERIEASWRALAAAVESGGRTVVIMLDDLQWADAESLELLLFVVRQGRHARLVVVSMWRDGPARSEEQAALAGKLAMDGATLYLPLRPLSRDDVVRITEQTTGHAPHPDIAAELHERSSGNPLFLTQLLETEWARRALHEPNKAPASSIDLKPELLASIARHVEGVSEACRALLDLASVLGREFALQSLAACAGKSADETLGLIDEGIRARVLAKGKAGSYRFAHPLVRDTLYKRISEPTRVAYHKAAGDALIALYGEAAGVHAAELARHFARGGSPLAAEWGKRAGEAAEARGAYADAVLQYEQAIDALGVGGDGNARGIELRIALANARRHTGATARSREALLDAAILAKACRLPDAVTRIEALLAEAP